MVSKQDERKAKIQLMKNELLKGYYEEWSTYRRLAVQFMVGTGASEYKTREYFDLLMELWKNVFVTRINPETKELEFKKMSLEERKKYDEKMEKELKQKLKTDTV